MTWINLPDCSIPGAKPQARAKAPWYEIRNAASDEAELLLFDEIGGWFGIYADEFVEQLNAVTAPKLTVRVNSPGGSVFEGIAVANALRAHPSEVTVKVEGLAASIASVIALAGDRLVLMPQAMLMIHDAAGGCWGQASDMQLMAEILDKVSDNIADAYAEKAGGTRAEWRERMRAETWYLADEAVEAGLADEVVRPAKAEPDEGDPAMAARWDLSVFRHAGRENAPAPTAKAVETPDDQASAPEPPHVPVAAAPQPPAEPTPEPTPAPPTDAVDPEPAVEPEPDPWAASIAHLLTPRAETWESLREALL